MPTKAILFFFGCLEVNSTWLITSELANQHARKVLFTCMVYTNFLYASDNLKELLHSYPMLYCSSSFSDMVRVHVLLQHFSIFVNFNFNIKGNSKLHVIL